MDLEDISRVRSDLKFRGAQGTTGTQASFMEIFHGDGAKIDKLNELLCQKAGFGSCYAISTQTYRFVFPLRIFTRDLTNDYPFSRKVDLRVANAMAALGDTVQRITSDVCRIQSLESNSNSHCD